MSLKLDVFIGGLSNLFCVLVDRELSQLIIIHTKELHVNSFE